VNFSTNHFGFLVINPEQEQMRKDVCGYPFQTFTNARFNVNHHLAISLFTSVIRPNIDSTTYNSIFLTAFMLSMRRSWEADKDCCLFLWHGDVILPYIKKNNRALWELSTMLVKRMRQASEIVEDLAFHPVASRVARLLLKQNQQSGTDHMERNLTLDEMATMVGTTPVMVCKIMSQFSDRGYLKVSRTEIEFIDRDQLKKIIDKN